jgi:hypothetical protein
MDFDQPLILHIQTRPDNLGISFTFHTTHSTVNEIIRFHLGVDGMACSALEWAERLDNAAQAIRKYVRNHKPGKEVSHGQEDQEARQGR